MELVLSYVLTCLLHFSLFFVEYTSLFLVISISLKINRVKQGNHVATAEQNRSQVMGIQCFNGSPWLLHLKTTCPSDWLQKTERESPCDYEF